MRPIWPAAAAEVSAIFDGYRNATPHHPNVGQIEGIFNRLPADHEQKFDPAGLEKAVATATETFGGAGIDGPYALLIPNGATELRKKYAAAKKDIDELAKGGVKTPVGLSDVWVLSTAKGNYDLHYGGGWRVRSLGTDSNRRYRFLLEEAIAFRVKEPKAAVRLTPNN